jgi:hypothetical protein
MAGVLRVGETVSTVAWDDNERWLLALEELVQAPGLVTDKELDSKTWQVLAAHAKANHQHAVDKTTAVATPRASVTDRTLAR